MFVEGWTGLAVLAFVGLSFVGAVALCATRAMAAFVEEYRGLIDSSPSDQLMQLERMLEDQRLALSTPDKHLLADAIAEAVFYIPRIVQGLQDCKLTMEARTNAAWALTNIASGAPPYVHPLYEHPDAIRALVSTAGKTHEGAELRGQCLWALGNIAGDSDEGLDAVFASTPLEMVHEAARDACGAQRNATLTTGATMLMSNLLIAPHVRASEASALFENALYSIAADERVETHVRVDALRGYINAFARTLKHPTPEAASLAASLLLHKERAMRRMAIRLAWDASSGSAACTRALVQGGALAAIPLFLEDIETKVVIAALATLSNICADAFNVQEVLDEPGLMDAVNSTASDRHAESKVLYEATHVAVNIARAVSKGGVDRTRVRTHVLEILARSYVGSDDDPEAERRMHLAARGFKELEIAPQNSSALKLDR